MTDYKEYWRSQKQGALSQSVTTEGSPERSAKSFDLSIRSGVPAEIIDTSVDEWAETIEAKERAAIVNRSPYITNFVNSHPLAANIGKDEFQQLDNAARMVGAFYPKKPKGRDPFAAFGEGFGDQPLGSFLYSDPDMVQFLQDANLISSDKNRLNIGTAITSPIIHVGAGALELFGRAWSGMAFATGEGVAGIADWALPQTEAEKFAVAEILGMDPEDIPQWGNTNSLKRDIINLVNFVGMWDGLGIYSARPLRKRTSEQNRMQLRLEMQRNRAEMDAVALDKSIEYVRTLKTRDRAPLLVAQHLNAAGEATMVIDSTTLLEYYASQGVVPHQGDKIFGWYPGIVDALEQPTVEIPMGVYVTYVDPAVHKKLYPSIRREQGMSIEQVKEAQELFEAAMKEVGATETSVIEKLREGGVSLRDLERAETNVELRLTDESVDLPTSSIRVFDIVVDDKIVGQTHLVEVPSESGGTKVKVVELYGGKDYDVATANTVGSANIQGLIQKVAEIYPTATTIEGFRSRVSGKSGLVEVPITRPSLGRPATIISEDPTLPPIRGTDVMGEFIPESAGPEAVVTAIQRKVTDLIAEELNLARDAEIVEDVVPTAIRSAEEAATIRESLYLDQVFKDEKSAGMTRQQYKLYSKRTEEQVVAEIQKGVKKAIQTARRMLSKEWKDTYAEALKRAETAYDARPEVIADAFLRDAVAAEKINVNEFVATRVDPVTGEVSVVSRPAPKGITSADGMAADDLAGLFGFRTGEELVEALSELAVERAPTGRARTPESHRKRVTTAQARAEVEAKMSDPMDVIDAAVEVASHDDVTKVLYDDLRVMRRQNENELSPPLSLDELKWKAADNFGRIPYAVASKLGGFIRAIADMGRKAEVMLLRNKPVDAFKAKNQQLTAVLNLKEAHKFQKLITRVERISKQYAKKVPGSVDHEFGDQVVKYLMTFGIPTRWAGTPEALNALPDLYSFVQKKRWDMMEFPDDPFPFQSGITVAQMDVNQYRAFAEMLIALDNQGRQAKKVFEAGRKVNKEGVLATMRAMVRDSKPIKSGQAKQIVMPFFRAVDALGLARVSRIFDRMEQWEARGPFQRFIIEPLNAGMSLRSKILDGVVREQGGLKIKNSKKLVANTQFLDLNGKPRRLNRGDVVMIALNLGNRRNRDLVVDTLLPPQGKDTIAPMRLEDTRPWREQQVLDFVQRTLTPEDWAYIDGTWKMFQWLKPQIDALYKRLSGSAPATVTGIDTLGHKGGYFPILRSELETSAPPEGILGPFEYDYHPTTTPNSHTKPRTQSTNPIRVEGAYTMLPGKIQQMVHDLAMREPVQNAHKLLSDKELRFEITHRYGSQYVKGLDQWLRFIANHVNDSDRMIGEIAKLQSALRANMSTFLLALNISTLATPTLGKVIFHPMHAKYIIRNWKEYRDFALEQSPLLQERKFIQNNDLWDISQDILGMQSRWTKMQRNGAYYGTKALFRTDQTIATIGWSIEYNRALNRGLSDADAVAIADKYVLDFHGSASPVNRAMIFNQGEQWRWVGFMYSWASTQYNLTHAILERTNVGFRKLKQGDYAGARRNFADVMANSVAVIAAPILLAGPFYTEWGDDDTLASFYGKSTFGFFTSLMPFVRDAAYWLQVGQNPQSSSITALGRSWTNALTSIEKAIEDDNSEADADIWIKRTADAVGMTFGLPTGQINKSAYFLWNLNTGEETPDTLLEWVRGVTKGYTESGGGRE